MTAASAHTPSDAEILAHMALVTDQATEDVPYVSAALPLSALSEEYLHGNQIFKQKIASLGSETKIFRIRGDGNCFYRAFAFALFKKLDEHERVAIEQKLTKIAQSMDMEKLVWEDFLETTKLVMNASNLHTAMNDAEQSNSVVVFLRFITSDYLKRHAEDYIPYLDGTESLRTWCERSVDPMGAEADHLQINALVNAIDVGVDIVNLDLSTTDAKANVHEVRSQNECSNVVKLLYRPGHYDVLQ